MTWLRSLRNHALAFSIIASGPEAVAQSADADVRLRLRSTEGLPVTGALVALLGADGRVVVEGISDERGVRVLRAPAGSYRIRVRRIGYRPFLSSEIAIPRTNELLLSVESARVSLTTVVVPARGDCKRVGPRDETLGVVWEEISKALRASQVTIEDLKGLARAVTYRDRYSVGGAVLSSDTSRFIVATSRPFGALPPALLASDGYVRGSPEKGWEYSGPDETVLLSTQFAETHCFRLVTDRDRAEEIGVAFEPLPKRKVADIAGVMWVDRRTSELREMTFRYVNAGLLSRFEAGGYTRFRKLPSGAWIVSDWKLRAPSLELRRGVHDEIVEIGHVENGGAILSGERVQFSTGRLATVRGVVYDSLTARPLSDAQVHLRSRSTTSDQAGYFIFPSILGGSGIVSFSHPALHAIGVVALQREIAVRPDTTEVLLATPSLKTVWGQICLDSATKDFRPNRGILHGFVQGPDGEPAANALVEIRWTEQTPSPGQAPTVARMALKVYTDTEGHFSACGFRPFSRGTAVASKEKARSGRGEFDFEPSPSLVLRRDLDMSVSGAPPR